MEWSALDSLEEGSLIEIKGFLIRAENGLWVLSEDPALKSCCAAKNGLKRELILSREYPDITDRTLLKIRGVFSKQEGAFCLKEREMIKKNTPPLTLDLIWGGAIVILLIAIGFKLKRLLLP